MEAEPESKKAPATGVTAGAPEADQPARANEPASPQENIARFASIVNAEDGWRDYLGSERYDELKRRIAEGYRQIDMLNGQIFEAKRQLTVANGEMNRLVVGAFWRNIGRPCARLVALADYAEAQGVELQISQNDLCMIAKAESDSLEANRTYRQPFYPLGRSEPILRILMRWWPAIMAIEDEGADGLPEALEIARRIAEGATNTDAQL